MFSFITEFSVCVELKDAPAQYEASGFNELFCNDIGLIEGGEIQQGMITRVDDSSEPIAVSQIVTAAMAAGDTIGCNGKVNVSPVEGSSSKFCSEPVAGVCFNENWTPELELEDLELEDLELELDPFGEERVRFGDILNLDECLETIKER